MAAADWVIPFLAGAVAALFAAKVWGQWSVRRRPHQLAWGIGLALYSLASFVEAYVGSAGWNEPAYRLFFAAAGANVGFLGLGTILLTRPGAWGRAFAIFVVIASLTAAIAQFAVPLAGIELAHTADPIPFTSPARWSFLLLNILGGLALIGGAILSWWQTRAAGVLLIGVGAMMPFVGGSLSTIEVVDMRVLLTFVGIVLMYVGYLRGRETLPPGAAKRPADG